MAYLAIARKWRPSKFDDLIGQEHVVRTLKNAIALDRVSHAYLFSGARGVGKTSVARIFAKALRCPNAVNASPCDHCEECVAIAESRSVDVAEIDGASHNGVEAVRAIRDNVAYSAASGTYKIYIIDEVHMLSLSAFNALLKTLEEPPPHVIFIFATTEVQKIPVTILSRCQRFEFRRLTQNQILQRLVEITTAESVTASEEALRLIASYSEGSLRDALSLLDQVLSHRGAERNFERPDVVEALGVQPINVALQFLSTLVEKDVQGTLKIIQDTYESGSDLKQFLERALEELRLLYLAVLAKEQLAQFTAEQLDVASDAWEELQRLASSLTRLRTERMAQILSKAASQLSWSSVPRFVLEMAAVRTAQIDELDDIEKLVREGAIEESPRPSSASSSAPVRPAPRAPEPIRPAVMKPVAPAPAPAPKAPAPVVKAEPAPAPEEPAHVSAAEPPPIEEMPPEPPMPTEPPPMEAGYADSFVGRPDKNWAAFVDTVMKKRPLLGALLHHAEFRMSPDKKAFLSFAEGSFYEKQAQDSRNRSEIEAWIRNYFGRDTTVEINASALELKSLERARQEEAESLKREALDHPLVAKMREKLGADVVDVNVEV